MMIPMDENDDHDSSQLNRLLRLLEEDEELEDIHQSIVRSVLESTFDVGHDDDQDHDDDEDDDDERRSTGEGHHHRQRRRQVYHPRLHHDRNRSIGEINLWRDYLGDHLQSSSSSASFESKFRLTKKLFFKLSNELQLLNPYWIQKQDCCKQMGLATVQKVVAALHQLACGGKIDRTMEEYVRLGESTAVQALKVFCSDVIRLYGREYLRPPTQDELVEIIADHNNHDDGKHDDNRDQSSRTSPPPPPPRLHRQALMNLFDRLSWTWLDCSYDPYPPHSPHHPSDRVHPKPKKGSQTTITLIALASPNLRFWSCFLGTPGGLKDLTDSGRSFYEFLKEDIQIEEAQVDGDGQGSHNSGDGTARLLSLLEQEGKRGVAEGEGEGSSTGGVRRKAFEALRSRWSILREPNRLWFRVDLESIFKTCIILHNMLVLDHHHHQTSPPSPPDSFLSPPSPPLPHSDPPDPAPLPPPSHHLDPQLFSH